MGLYWILEQSLYPSVTLSILKHLSLFLFGFLHTESSLCLSIPPSHFFFIVSLLISIHFRFFVSSFIHSSFFFFTVFLLSYVHPLSVTDEVLHPIK